MNDAYQDTNSIKKYLAFLDSENGKIQQSVILDAVKQALPRDISLQVLDAGCGNGWLTKKLSESYPKIWACDSSKALIEYAQKNFSGLNFAIADLTQDLPYSDGFFDSIILNMSAPDIDDLSKAFKNLTAKLKPSGQLVMVIPNPYYTYPVAEWKRGLTGALSFEKPVMVIKQPYFGGKHAVEREFNRGDKISSHFYTLTDYLSAAADAGLHLTQFKELKSVIDSPKFNLQYQLYRYPLLLLVEFKK